MRTISHALAPSALATALLFAAAGHATGSGDTSSLKRLSIEELMDIEVTSVSRSAETLSSAAAAISVVTSDDIRRSGATTIPEALRGVPGLHVARRNSNSWAVSSRAFSSITSEKLLVLSDTRSIYTPLLSGVMWDVQDYLMQDIERIEVIRGPGASLWGANAVNGVINITTRHARNTQGTLLTATLGTEEQAGAARYGGKFGESGFFRVFGQYSDRDATFHPGATSSDDWRIGHAGFRADWDASSSDALTLQADLYRANIGQFAPAITVIGRPGPQGNLEVHAAGGNVLGRWRRQLAPGSDLQLRVYFDHTHRDDPSFHDDLDTVDLELQHRYVPSSRHEIVWGLNYRYTDNSNRGNGIFAVAPEDSRDQLIGAFAQDQFAISDALRLTLGTKLEHNDFSGFEVQPSVRLAWDVAPGQNAWAAVSRAVRVPTRLERDIAVEATPPGSNPRAVLLGNDDFDVGRVAGIRSGLSLATARRAGARPRAVPQPLRRTRFAGVRRTDARSGQRRGHVPGRERQPDRCPQPGCGVAHDVLAERGLAARCQLRIHLSRHAAARRGSEPRRVPRRCDAAPAIQSALAARSAGRTATRRAVPPFDGARAAAGHRRRGLASTLTRRSMCASRGRRASSWKCRSSVRTCCTIITSNSARRPRAARSSAASTER